MVSFEGPLGRLPAPDDRHLQRYSLTAPTMPDKPVPVGVGTDWREAFDRRYEDAQGRHWLVEPGSGPDDWGRNRGGHAWTLKPHGVDDTDGWWRKYNQQRNDCVGYMWSRMCSLMNRQFYHAPIVYDRALLRDEWPGEADEGTSVRAGGEVALYEGMWPERAGKVRGPFIPHGIAAFRWCRTIEDVAYCLDPATRGQRILKRGYADMLQSWGPSWPHIVRVPTYVLAWLLFNRGGDSTIVTDR